MFDVAVIGAGMAGLVCAQRFVRRISAALESESVNHV